LYLKLIHSDWAINEFPYNTTTQLINGLYAHMSVVHWLWTLCMDSWIRYIVEFCNQWHRLHRAQGHVSLSFLQTVGHEVLVLWTVEV